MGFLLSPVDVRSGLTANEFQKSYVDKNLPVVLKDFSAHWPAINKWTFAYFKKYYGDLEVPVMREAFATSGNSYTSASQTMKLRDYLAEVEAGPTNLRIFLFNMFKAAPELKEDFDFPPIIDNYLKSQPFIFFGGEGSAVDAHMDLDLSHVLMTQFAGTKKVILFHPKYSTRLYRHPLTVSTNVDVGHPDFEKYPLLKNLPGLECTLEHGDTLFMPSAWWHYIYYNQGGFALSLRALADSYLRRAQGAYRIAMLLGVDRGVTKMLGPKKWYAIKEAWANLRAHNTFD